MAITKMSNSGIATGGSTKYDDMLAGNLGVPPAPTAAAAVNGATITFSAIAGATNYQVLSSGGQTATGASSPISVTGLTGGTSYTFQLRYTTAAGTSGYSQPSNSVTALSAVGVIARLEPSLSTASLYSQKGFVINGASLYLLGLYSAATDAAYYGSINATTLTNNFHNIYNTGSGTYATPSFSGAVNDFDGNITSSYNGAGRSAQVSVGRTSTSGISSQSTNVDGTYNQAFDVDYQTTEQVYYQAGWYDGTGLSMAVRRDSGYSATHTAYLTFSGVFNYFHGVAARQGATGGAFFVGDAQLNPRIGTIWHSTPTLTTNFIRAIGGGSGTSAFLDDVVYNTTDDAAVAVGNYQGVGVIVSWDRNSGNINWQNGVGAGGALYSMGWDSANNMYYAASDSGHIFKFNSSGVIQWQRRLTISNGNSVNFQGGKILFAGSDYIITGRFSTGTGQNTIVLRMPKDGSGSGGSINLNGLTFTYTTTTKIISSEGLTNVNPSISRGTFTVSNNTTPHTRTTLTVTNTAGAI